MDQWQHLIDRISLSARELRVDQFIIVEYATGSRVDPEPYGQAAHAGPDMICEVVSGTYLPASAWPLHEINLRRAGWCPPSQGTDNWWRLVATPQDVASVLIEGLREGRDCSDPNAFRWAVGTFPPGPGDGESIPLADGPDLELALVA